MRILTIIQEYPPLRRIGSEMYDHDLHRYLIKQGHSIEVIAVHSTESWEYQGVKVNPTRLTEPDIILTHADYRQKAHYHRRLKGWMNVPIIGILHNDQTQAISPAKLFQWDGLIANSEHLKGLIVNVCPQTVLIPPTPKPSTKIPAGKGILHIGLTQEKGAPLFYELAEALPDHDFTGVIGGWGTPIIKEEPNIKILPHQKTLVPLFKTHHILILPSLFESWAMVASEAMAYGLTVITYDDLPGVAENVGKAGILVPRNDQVEPWVDAITKHRKRTAVNLRQAQSNYTLHKQQLKETEKFLIKIVEEQ